MNPRAFRNPAILGLIIALPACGGRNVRTKLDPLFDTSAARQAKSDAPELYQAARHARDAAEDEEDAEVSSDHQVRSRLLLGAAVLKAKRTALREMRFAAETEARTYAAQARNDERAREVWIRKQQRRRAAEVALEQARLAFETAEEDEARRYRARGAEVRRVHAQASRALATRARSLTAVAVVLGASATRADAIYKALDEAKDITDATERMRRVDASLQAARSLLGEARRSQAAPSEDERASLIAAAQEQNFSASRTEHGIVCVPRSARTSHGVWAQRLASLLRAHPHGPVVIEIRASSRAKTRSAESLWNTTLKKEGVDLSRVQVQPQPAGSGSTSVRVVWTGYGPEPKPPEPSSGAASSSEPSLPPGSSSPSKLSASELMQ